MSRQNFMIQSFGFFLLAGLCEIGGGYLVWLWLREGKSLGLGTIGLILLGLYGVVATLQPLNFGRAYAAYGGVFIVLSVLWGWWVDQLVPDRFDVLGSCVALLGVLIMLYAPRN
jgi:small multidrug resistance family-3 protein